MPVIAGLIAVSSFGTSMRPPSASWLVEASAAIVVAEVLENRQVVGLAQIPFLQENGDKVRVPREVRVEVTKFKIVASVLGDLEGEVVSVDANRPEFSGLQSDSSYLVFLEKMEDLPLIYGTVMSLRVDDGKLYWPAGPLADDLRLLPLQEVISQLREFISQRENES